MDSTLGKEANGENGGQMKSKNVVESMNWRSNLKGLKNCSTRVEIFKMEQFLVMKKASVESYHRGEYLM